jgi:hypothetical protein
MLRKFMAVVALSAVPVISIGVTQVAMTGGASAAKVKTTTCTGGAQTVTFAAPGISNTGTAQASKKSTDTTSAAPSISCTGKITGTGTTAASNIKSKSTVTCANDTGTKPTPCPTGDYVIDSASQFASGASTLYKDVKTASWTIGSTTYVTSNTGSAQATSCPSTETGFVLTGKLTAPASQNGKASTITVCLNGDTGPNTTGNFYSDIVSEAFGNTSIVIATATFDPSTSSIVFA